MGFLTRDRLKSLLKWLPQTILVVLSFLVSQLNDSHFDEVQRAIPYKWILILLTLSILLIIYSFVYHKAFPNTGEKEKALDKSHKNIMENLSFDERKILTSFLKPQPTKFLKLPMNETTTNLKRNEVIYSPFHEIKSQVFMKDDIYTFHISEWAWEYINKNKRQFS